MLPLLAAVIVIIAALRDWWMTEVSVNPAAAAPDEDGENQKLELQSILWRLDQLEKYVFKDDPSKSSILGSQKKASILDEEAERDQPSVTDKILNVEPTFKPESRTSDTAVTTGLEAELNKVKRAIQVFAQRKFVYLYVPHQCFFRSLAFSNCQAQL